MATKKIQGLASLKIAPIASDGGMGTALVSFGETVQGTPQITSEENTTTDFLVEESDSPIESIVTQAGKLIFAWSSYKLTYANLVRVFGGTGNPYQVTGTILTFGAITPGSAYTNGYYENVPLTGGAGTGATAHITVAGGVVTAVELASGGATYGVGNSLSALAANMGGTGTGFAVATATVASGTTAEKYEFPDTFSDIERSLQLTDRRGNVVNIPRCKLSAKMGVSFTKDKLGQVDVTATILQPTKSGEKRMTIVFAQTS